MRALVMLALVARVATYPNGMIVPCSDALPAPSDLVKDNAVVVECSNGACSAHLADRKPFRGVLVYPLNDLTTLVAVDPATQRNERCIVHASNTEITSARFNVTGAHPVVRVTLVLRRDAGAHVVVVSEPTPVVALKAVHIIGAGPGGLAAAMRLSHVCAVHVYEKGQKEPEGFYSMPIRDTSHMRTTAACSPGVMNATVDEYRLACMVGGNQNVNGAVYAPGTHGDLARSVGVAIDDARAAMQFVSALQSRDGFMMWACKTQGDCDHATFASANAKMTRKSIAAAITWTRVNATTYTNGSVTLHTNCTASLVHNGQVVFEGNCAPTIDITPESPVILAAGALADPQLLGEQSFKGYNHYYKTDFELKGKVSRQTLTYDEARGVETNGGMVTAERRLEVKMLMLPTFMEQHTVGKPYTLPQEASKLGMNAQAWHFMGTVNHTGLRVQNQSNVYVGDAAALATPFNCHTSAPAAAAGVLAADAITGRLGTNTDPGNGKGIQSVAPALFIAGTFALAAGAAAHVVQATRALHYLLMPLGTLLLCAGVGVASTTGNANATHRAAGYTVLIMLVCQSFAGIYIRTATHVGKGVRTLHRLSGCALLLAAAFVCVSGSRSSAYASHEHSNAVVATVFSAGVALVAGGLLARLAWPTNDQNIKIDSKSLL